MFESSTFSGKPAQEAQQQQHCSGSGHRDRRNDNSKGLKVGSVPRSLWILLCLQCSKISSTIWRFVKETSLKCWRGRRRYLWPGWLAFINDVSDLPSAPWPPSPLMNVSKVDLKSKNIYSCFEEANIKMCWMLKFNLVLRLQNCVGSKRQIRNTEF